MLSRHNTKRGMVRRQRAPKANHAWIHVIDLPYLLNDYFQIGLTM
jgi:hypothetical protein